MKSPIADAVEMATLSQSKSHPENQATLDGLFIPMHQLNLIWKT